MSDTLPGGIKPNQARALLFERASINEQARTASLALASEFPVERGFGLEVLDCAEGSMRSGRLRAGANLLCDHDTRDVVGVVESVEIGADKVVRAVVRFGKSARAEEVWQDVRDGIRRNVSVGYLIHEAKLVEQRDGLDTYRVTDWEPYEVSLVSVPADASVGVGRSADAVTKTEAGAPPQEDAQREAETPAAVSTTTETKETPMTEVVQVAEKRDHAGEISKIAGSIPGGADLALSAIQRGLTVEQFQREALEKLSSKPLPTADIGMSDKEARQFSYMRAINALANPTDAGAQRAAGLEREASDAVSKVMGKSARGFYVPHDVMKRDLTAGTNNAGGFTVATDLLAGSFIDALRNAMVISGMGTRMLTGLQGLVAIPKLASGATHYWVAENAAPTESQQTMAQVTMSPKTVGAFTDISRRLLLQSSIDVEMMVRDDLAKVLGLAIQGAAISGTGASNQPSGLLTLVTPSVIGGTNGLAPTWPHIIELETDVAVANADIGTMGYLTNAKARGKLKGTEKFSSTNGSPVWEAGDTPLNGYRAGVTNAVPSNLTKGTSTGVASAIIFGNFADLMIGMWGALDLMADPYTGSTAGTVRVVALQDVDVAVRNVESFATMVDALTA
jgi:HK97 family phage major capsid protein/HK97 family phage prohead protease